MKCIFCDEENEANSIEHIVPESFGNKKYVMKKGEVCDICNGRFSKFEKEAQTKSIFVMERARLAIRTKKDKNVKGEIKKLTIEGDKNFREKYINVNGLNEENMIEFNPATGIGYLIIPSFDKTEVATSKLLLKMGLESIYNSQKTLFKKYIFKDLKDFLTVKNNKPWPFLTTDFEIQKFCSVPKYDDKFLLKQRHCELKFVEIDENTLLFKFKFGAIAMTINLLNRNLNWIKDNLNLDKKSILYPEHFRNKISKSIADVLIRNKV